ncbi:Golgi resident protein GCP60-like [Oppia nitens]|uniref:Golgi resident protein GCP60-like n=1 Tax=Oppia nitens TaxID=1686743 RepID=UPI0023DA0156|nr:Golgi resident protein GCP60-like [Oppia nitens]
MSQTETNSKPSDDTTEDQMNGLQNDDDLVSDWHLQDWTQLYKIAIKFYKDNESKAFHPSYDNRNQFMAFIFQEKYGKFDASKAKPLGPLDIVGKDRRNSWISLTDTNQLSAQKGFVKLLHQMCPLFEPYVKAFKVDFDEKERLKRVAKEAEEKRLHDETERQRIEEEIQRKAEEEKKLSEEQKHAVQEALNRQTYQQFKSYAEQQYPGNIEQQNDLIRQLQEQHYQQYLLQVREQELQRSHNQNMNNSYNNNLNHESDKTVNLSNNTSLVTQTIKLEPKLTNEEEDQNYENNHHLEPTTGSESESDSESFGPIAGASMWTRKEIVSFKESIRAEGGDGIIKVGHGEIVTVRVPTHKDGTCIFWEFCTDSYDIGFGLLFEWTKNPGNQVSVHISESEDEEDEEEEGETAIGNDIEKGQPIDPEKETLSPKSGQTDTSPISVIIPIYRRDSHEEVFSGSHVYPGSGIYLLKFDNSYSLWRSKTLYYRVYYTR